MVALARLFNRLQSKRVLVAGDFMLDRYIFGKSKRISPEAPVPVVLVDSEENKAGGAGNVALNLQSLGMEVSAIGRIGTDEAGVLLEKYLEQEGIKSCLYRQPGFQTPNKTRVIASSQQIVRIDYERVEPLHTELEEQILQAIPAVVKSHDVVAISDYAKGFLTEKVLQALITAARQYNIPVIADPKGIDFFKYRGATVLKPNLGEAIAASGVSGNVLKDISEAIFHKVDVDVLMITRSEAGISLYFPDGRSIDHPVAAKEIRDVTGAGDTVLAMVSCALANGLSISEGTQLANIAATIAVERIGCARVTLAEVARRLIDLHGGSKIFTHEHMHALEHALRGQAFIVLSLEPSCEVTPKLLRQVRELGVDQEKELLVSIQDLVPDQELINVLSSLKDVDYIHVCSNPSESAHFLAKPCQVVHFKN